MLNHIKTLTYSSFFFYAMNSGQCLEKLSVTKKNDETAYRTIYNKEVRKTGQIENISCSQKQIWKDTEPSS